MGESAVREDNGGEREKKKRSYEEKDERRGEGMKVKQNV
jgi:hypothetical protein